MQHISTTALMNKLRHEKLGSNITQPQAMWHRAFVLATTMHCLLAELAGSRETHLSCGKSPNRTPQIARTCSFPEESQLQGLNQAGPELDSGLELGPTKSQSLGHARRNLFLQQVISACREDRKNPNLIPSKCTNKRQWAGAKAAYWPDGRNRAGGWGQSRPAGPAGSFSSHTRLAAEPWQALLGVLWRLQPVELTGQQMAHTYSLMIFRFIYALQMVSGLDSWQESRVGTSFWR